MKKKPLVINVIMSKNALQTALKMEKISKWESGERKKKCSEKRHKSHRKTVLCAMRKGYVYCP